MSMILEDKQQLAAPRRLDTVSPPPFALTGRMAKLPATPPPPVVDLVPATMEEPEPSSVAQARRLVDHSKTSPMAWARLAQAEMAAGKRDQAVDTAREALHSARREPDDSAVYSAARILIACGLLAEAENAIAKLDPSGPVTVLHATLAAERGDLDTAFRRLDDDASVDAWDLRGWIALRESHFDQAVRFFRKALRAGGPSPALLTNIGLAHAALGAGEKAIAETRQALALSPSQKQRVVFNLVAYLVADGRPEEAMQYLAELQSDFPTDIEPVFAEAHWRLAIGEPERAEKKLRYARTQLWGHATHVQQAELLANLAYVRWQRGALSRDKAAAQVIEQLEGIRWASVRLGAMLPVLLCRYSAFSQLDMARTKIREANPDSHFPAIEMQWLILRDKIEEATDVAVAWSQGAIFAPEAAMAATFLLVDARDEFDQAVELGSKALQRMPASYLVANNVAYALALANRPKEALRFLASGDESPYHLATLGLIAARQGSVAVALEMYDRAKVWADQQRDPTLATSVALYRRLALSLDASTVESCDAQEAISLPSDWDDDPRMVLILRMLHRRGVSLAGIAPRGQPELSSDIGPRSDHV